MNGLLLRELNDGVLRLTLNDAASRNSLSAAMIDALLGAIAGCQARAIIIAANGPVFSSGHNLKEITAHRADADEGMAYFKDLFDKCATLMLAITQHRCPVIAEVDGLASAAGCQLVASCDLAIATDRSTFCTPGVNIGLFCSTPMVALSRAVGPRHAREMLLTGDVYDAAHALRIGLVNEIVPEDSLTKHVTAMAAKIASKSQTAIGIGKPAFELQSDMDLHAAYAHCSKLMVENFLVASAREGVGAVLEKRKAVWPAP